MSRQRTIEPPKRLLLAWQEAVEERHLLLPLMLLVAAVLHLLPWGLFTVERTRPESPPETRSAALQMLLPSSPTAEAYAAWLEAADPTLFSPVKTEEPAGWEEVLWNRFEPSFLRAPLTWMPPEAVPEGPNEGLPPPFPVKVHRESFVSQHSSPVTARQSMPSGGVTSEPAVCLFLPEGVRKVRLPGAPSSGALAKPAEFVILLGEGGRAEAVFLISSSGSGEWDAAAEKFLLGLKIPDAEGPLWLNAHAGQFALQQAE